MKNYFAGILRAEPHVLVASIRDADNLVSDGLTERLNQEQAARNTLQSLFVERETDLATARVRIGGSDEGQEIGPDGRPRETYTGADVSVAFPLMRVGWALGYNEEDYAKLTIARLEEETQAKIIGNARRHMREIFRALLAKDNYTYPDDVYGDLTIRRLANGDSQEYPIGDGESTDDHYLVSGYAASAISATNNPFVTIAEEVREHFQSDTRIVAFINQAQRGTIIENLTTLVTTAVEGITPALGSQQAIEPSMVVPGEFVGVDEASGVYIYVYNRVPAGYILGGTVDEARPLRRRVPEPITLRGFKVVDEQKHWPFYKKTWVERFGYGVANRLSWVSMQLKASGNYETPKGIIPGLPE